MRYKIPYFLVMLSVSASADTLNDQYAEYARHAKEWESIRTSAEDCRDPSRMANFLLRSLEIQDWVQTSEDNALFAEEMAIKDPQCVVAALKMLPHTTVQEVWRIYFEEPLYHKEHDFAPLKERLLNGS